MPAWILGRCCRRSGGRLRRSGGRQARRFAPDPGLGTLEGRVLLSASFLRIASYNIATSSGTPRSGLGTILQAIGSEAVNGLSRPVDVLALQEVRSQVTTTADVVA